MDPSLMDPNEGRLAPGNEMMSNQREEHVAVFKPSAKAAIPTAIGWLLLALVCTAALVFALAQRPDLTYLLGPRLALLMGLIWGVCLIPLLYKLLVLKTVTYSLSTQRLEYTRGILHRRRDQLELVRIRDITSNRTLMDRLLGIGTVILDTVDRSHPEFRIEAQPNVYGLSDWLHRLNAAERQRLGYREYEGTQGL